MTRDSAAGRPEVWAGPECSFLTVGDWACDQLALTGHAARLDDIERLASLGVSAVRYPVLWGRAGRASEPTDWDWAETRLSRLAGHGIRPVVGLLHHGFGPVGSDPLDAEWPAAFGRYAGEVARRFPAVTSFVPINEPLTTARFGALYGWWAPYARDDGTFIDLLLAEAQAYVLGARAIRKARPGSMIVVNEDIGTTFGTAAVREAVDHANLRRWLTFDLAMGHVDRSHPLWTYLAGTARRRRVLDFLRLEPERPDVLGVDHYITSDRYLDHRLDLFPQSVIGEGATRYADVELARVGGFPMDSFARSIDQTWRRYGHPIALTEVHLAGETPDQLAWWSEAWSAACAATVAGVSIRSVTAWSTFGAFDWANVLRNPSGAYEAGCFDAATGIVRRRELADVVAATAAGADPGHGPGWWRDDGRVLYAPEQPRAAGDSAAHSWAQQSDLRSSRRARGATSSVPVAPRRRSGRSSSPSSRSH